MTVSIITCVNDFEAYNAHIKDGVYAPKTQLVPVDNTDNSMSAAQALNVGIDRAVHEIVVCCHQDVRFPAGWVDTLHRQIMEIHDHDFGVLGTFGIDMDGSYAGNIRQPNGNPKMGDLPRLVQSLDEHCLIIRKSSGLRFDEELGGFHLYGADICLEASWRNMKNYAIDAYLEHMSRGTIDRVFWEMQNKFIQKWEGRGLRGPLITTCSRMWFGEIANVPV